MRPSWATLRMATAQPGKWIRPSQPMTRPLRSPFKALRVNPQECGDDGRSGAVFREEERCGPGHGVYEARAQVGPILSLTWIYNSAEVALLQQSARGCHRRTTEGLATRPDNHQHRIGSGIRIPAETARLPGADEPIRAKKELRFRARQKCLEKAYKAKPQDGDKNRRLSREQLIANPGLTSLHSGPQFDRLTKETNSINRRSRYIHGHKNFFAAN